MLRAAALGRPSSSVVAVGAFDWPTLLAGPRAHSGMFLGMAMKNADVGVGVVVAASAPVAVARDKSPAADVASVRAVLAELVAAVLGQAVPDDMPLMQARRKRGG